MWLYLIFAIHLHLLWTWLIRVREHGTSRNEPKQTTIQVTLGSCNDCKMFRSFEVGRFQSLKVYNPETVSLRTDRPVCGKQSFQEEPFSWYHINNWVFPKIVVPQNGWFLMENPIKMDDWGVPLFSETSISSTFGCSDVCVPLVFCLKKSCVPDSHELPSTFHHHVSSHAIECPSLVLPYHFLIWILFSSYHFSPAFPTILASI